MRIIAGQFRGTKLDAVGKGDADAHLRPTSDRVRESLFNVLAGGRFGEPISGARVLDLFAGTGALGLEALSRGAAHATFVDQGRAALSLIRANIARLGVAGQTEIIAQDALLAVARLGAPFDLVFLDPPYGKSMGGPVLGALFKAGLLSPVAVVVWEERAPQTAPAGLRVLDIRKYGETTITFLARSDLEI